MLYEYKISQLASYSCYIVPIIKKRSVKYIKFNLSTYLQFEFQYETSKMMQVLMC